MEPATSQRGLYRSPRAAAIGALALSLAVASAQNATAQQAPAAVPGTSPAAASELLATTLPKTAAQITGVGGVSCISATLCFAVGDATVTHGRTQLTSNTALIWRYNGHAWRLSDRLRMRQSALVSISCSSASFCLAVGRVGNPSGHALALRWNGRSWSPIGAPSPPSSGNGDALGSGACLSHADCWAVGGKNLGESAAGTHNTLLEHRNGRRLVLVSATGTGGSLVDVACAGADACWATERPIGRSSATYEIANFNGRRWAPERLPIAMSGGEGAISCATLTTCWIVGDRNSGGLRPAAVHLIDGTWQSVPMASPQHPDVTLQGIACVSERDCWAVGSNELVGPGIANPSEAAPFAEEWDGTSWRMAKIAGAARGFLVAVSCTSAGLCAAGGQSLAGDPLAAIATPLG